MNNAEHEDFLELLRVYRRVTVSGQTLETAVMTRFLWNTKGRLISLKASVRLTTSTPDDVVLTIVDSVQVGERVQVALGAEFVDNHEYELREMRKITLTVGFLRGDEDFIRDCIGNWYRGVGLTPQQYTNVLYRGYHKSINVEVGIGLLTQAGDRLVVNLDPLVIHAEAHSLLGALTGSATGVVHGAGVSQVLAPGGIPSGEMVGTPGIVRTAGVSASATVDAEVIRGPLGQLLDSGGRELVLWFQQELSVVIRQELSVVIRQEVEQQLSRHLTHRQALPMKPEQPGRNGWTWDDVFDWYYRTPRHLCPNLKNLAPIVAVSEPTIKRKHAEYRAEHGEYPLPDARSRFLQQM